jgi:peroxiredoxin
MINRLDHQGIRMSPLLRTLTSTALFALLLVCSSAASAHGDAAQKAPNSPADIQPLLLGATVPSVELKTIDDRSVALSEVIGGKPALLVFYRGGWCPYCNLQLQGLRLIQDQLGELGYQTIAVSPDSPASLRKTLDKTPLEYTLLSDSSANAISAFGIAFRVDDATVEKYQGYGIDLASAAGSDHHLLPVPAVYLVDANGTLQFSYVHPDYTSRLPENVILAAAQAIHDNAQKIRERQKAK